MPADKNIIFDKDVSLTLLKEKKIAIIGYGNQGRAQALNLRDSKLKIKIGLRENSKSLNKVKCDGIDTLKIKDAVKWADIICLMIPDKIAPQIYKESIHPYLASGKTLLFSHGYNIHFKKIDTLSNINIILVAPSAGGKVVREEYIKGTGVPALLAVDQDFSGNALELAKSYAKGIGSTRICAFISTFKEETETDIFGEQAILTGGLPYLIKSSYNTLIKNGYNKTVAWFVCYYELKTIVDLFHNKGFSEFYKLISDTARYGGISRGKLLIDDQFNNKLQSMIDSIQSGEFDKELSTSIDNKELPDSFKNLEIQTKKMLNFIKKN